jgi:hypothetical protein
VLLIKNLSEHDLSYRRSCTAARQVLLLLGSFRPVVEALRSKGIQALFAEPHPGFSLATSPSYLSRGPATGSDSSAASGVTDRGGPVRGRVPPPARTASASSGSAGADGVLLRPPPSAFAAGMAPPTAAGKPRRQLGGGLRLGGVHLLGTSSSSSDEASGTLELPQPLHVVAPAAASSSSSEIQPALSQALGPAVGGDRAAAYQAPQASLERHGSVAPALLETCTAPCHICHLPPLPQRQGR